LTGPGFLQIEPISGRNAVIRIRSDLVLLGENEGFGLPFSRRTSKKQPMRLYRPVVNLFSV
jgi:hypothetical protein